MNASAGTTLANAGTFTAGQQAVISAATVDNSGGSTSAKLLSNTDLSLASGALNNNGGQIGAGANETIHTGSLNGVSNTDFNQTTGSSIKVGGVSQIGVRGDLTATGADIRLAGGGTLAANGNVTLQAAKATSTTNSNSSGSDSHGSYSESLHRSDDSLTATTLNAGNSLTVASGKDSGQQIGVSGGYGGDIGKTQKGTATNVNPVPGTTLPSTGASGANGIVAAPPVALSASDEAGSTTRSAISGGAIHITDSTKQQQLTGQTADDAVASISRDTTGTQTTLAPIFDKNKIEAGFDITSQFVDQAGTFVNNRAKEADAAKAAASNPDLTPEQRAQAQQRADQLNAEWGPSGSYRQVLTALTVAAGGNVTGGMGQFAQNATVAYLQELGTNGVKQIADSLGSDEARAALHAIVGCAGAAASSQSCGAGAMGASASSVIGSLLGPTTNMSAADREARENLVNSLVAGIAAASGANAATATGAGQIEAENNQVSLTTTTGFRLPPIPGFKGETTNKGDGVIADPATELDASAKAGPLITPLPGPGLIDQIFTPVGDAVKGLVDYVITSVNGNQATDSTGAPPPNMSPDGAGRSGAFNEAKRAAGIPVSQQPSAVYPNTDKRGNPQPGYQYEYSVPTPGGGTQTVIIRDDAAGHSFGDGNPQNRGPHFNDPAGNHYDY